MAGKKRGGDSSVGSKTSAANGGGGGDDCDIAIDCDLSGVRPEVLAGVNKGDRLGLRIESGEPYRSVVCVTASSQVVGAISALSGHGRIIRCLEQGLTYEVVVHDVGAGRCHVIGGVAS